MGIKAHFLKDNNGNKFYPYAHASAVFDSNGQKVEKRLNDLDTNKIDKQDGKSLSSNDYTDEEKNKLASIQPNAKKNVQSDWNEIDSTSDAYIKNKPTSLPSNGGNSDTVNGHTVNSDVPKNAKFTDTIYDDTEIKNSITELDNNLNESISSHTSNTSNPHSVTKAQVGLGNVENKSSKTIRGEITKSNVTTALGYTPYTPNEVDNKFSALETNIDWKESVATYDDITATYPNPVDGWTVNVKDTDYTYRYNGTSWVAISANAIPKATNSVDGLLSKEDHANYEDANSKKHTHSNKSVIDSISSTNVSNWNSAKTHADSTHARTDATKVESSTTNGNIKINGTETTVYTHPSGTNPHGTTKSDVGLGNVGNFKSVSTVASQGLTDTEKSNARANIGAGTSSFSGSYNDLTNKPTIPSVGNGTVTIKQAGTSKGTFTMNQSGNTTIELTDNNTTYGVATSSALGLVKSGTDITVDSNGNVSINDDSHNHVISNVDGLQSALDGKASSSHTHDDRYYTESEIDSKLSGKANSSHGTHVPSTCKTITDWNSATTTGWYMGSNIANAPSTEWYFGYVIAHNANYVVQEVYQFTASTDAKAIPKYIRAKMNGTWGSWTEVTVQKKVPSDAVFTDTTYSVATTSSNGLMSSTDKTKLNGIANGATANTGTVTSVAVKMNGSTKGTITSSGTIDLGTVLTGGSQTTTSSADGGSNVYTFSDGSTITVKNGSKGSKGDSGSNGTNGTNGTSAAWFTGTAVTGTASSVTASVSGSKAGDMYLNTSTYNVYTATAANTWKYVCNIKGGQGSQGNPGTTPTIKAANGTNIGSVGTPSVTASTSGTETTFTFNYLKGAKGEKGDKGDTGTIDSKINSSTWNILNLNRTGSGGFSGLQFSKADTPYGGVGMLSSNGSLMKINTEGKITDTILDSNNYSEYIQVPKDYLVGGSQTTISTQDGGNNIFTFSKSDGSTSSFVVKNGSKGEKGDKGDPGTIDSKINSSTWNILNLNRTGSSGDFSGLQFSKADTPYGGVGMLSSNGSLIKINTEGKITDTILDSNNYSEYIQVINSSTWNGLNINCTNSTLSGIQFSSKDTTLGGIGMMGVNGDLIKVTNTGGVGGYVITDQNHSNFIQEKSTNINYPILLSSGTDTSKIAYTNSNLSANPSTGTLMANVFQGLATGIKIEEVMNETSSYGGTIQVYCIARRIMIAFINGIQSTSSSTTYSYSGQYNTAIATSYTHGLNQVKQDEYAYIEAGTRTINLKGMNLQNSHATLIWLVQSDS